MNDYERIAAVIRHLDRHAADQPALGDLAAAARLSESHFHRLFRRWAGVTPKDFLQCLTAEHARRLLHRSRSVLDASLEAGLSGPGRLHDLFVTLEAATPGEIKSRGEGIAIGWGVADSPFGSCAVAWTGRGLCHLSFLDASPGNGPPPDLLGTWSKARLARDDGEARDWTGRVFSREANPGEPLPAHVRGTEFQVKVWRALLRVPEGAIVSYSGLAEAAGSPGAARAAGSACGKNPIAYLIPCHRAIRETGIVTGYRWGNARKKAILARETAGT